MVLFPKVQLLVRFSNHIGGHPTLTGFATHEYWSPIHILQGPPLHAQNQIWVLRNRPLNRKVPATSSQISKKCRQIMLALSWNGRWSSFGKEGDWYMEARSIPEGIKISRKLRFDPSVWLLYGSHCYWAIGVISHICQIETECWKKIEHNVVMNVKILIDQVARYGKEWVQRS